MPEEHVLSLFADAGPVDTPTPGVRAWLARDAGGGRQPVLIKRTDGAAGGRGRATEALALLHPNVVRTRRWLLDGGALYVVRDVVRGKNLRQSLSIEGTQRSAETVRRLLLPVVAALEYAHGRGFAHGGVSAENVLVGEEGKVYVSDFATADPKAPQHFLYYEGTASYGGDVRALGKLIAEFLPTVGAFANPAMRDRIAVILGRSDTLADLKETVSALERLAAAPMPRPRQGGSASPPTAGAPPPVSFGLDLDEAPTAQAEEVRTVREHGAGAAAEGKPGAGDGGVPRLICTLAEKSARVTQGGGGTATLIVRNEGSGTLVVRMIATQHAWLNVKTLELPLRIPPGGYEPVPFAISAARLTPGEYRSEVYLSANATAKSAEDLRGGWFRHTAELRITVEASPTLVDAGASSSGGKPPYPADAPRIPAGPGCALVLPAVVLAWLALCYGG